jgi:hypothetical protein
MAHLDSTQADRYGGYSDRPPHLDVMLRPALKRIYALPDSEMTMDERFDTLLRALQLRSGSAQP